jgi:ketosteroid isomerase-like protein
MRRTLLSIAMLVVPVIAPAAAPRTEARTVAVMLDDWYDAADKGDGPRYFSRFTDDAVFLGTDPEERWTISAFRAAYEHYFDGHHAWTYVARQRHVFFSPDGRTGWFDEKLVSPKYGELRATGVVVRSHGAWKIAQYNLTIPIPNAVVPKLVEILKPPR